MAVRVGRAALAGSRPLGGASAWRIGGLVLRCRFRVRGAAARSAGGGSCVVAIVKTLANGGRGCVVRYAPREAMRPGMQIIPRGGDVARTAS
jgi:hypothetical protein